MDVTKGFAAQIKQELVSGKPAAEIKVSISNKVSAGNDDPLDLVSNRNARALKELFAEIRKSSTTEPEDIKARKAVTEIDNLSKRNATVEDPSLSQSSFVNKLSTPDSIKSSLRR